MEDYNTLLEALDGLKAQGYTEDFNLSQKTLECRRLALSLNPGEYSIDKVFRYEGNTDPDDESALYAISSHDGKVKGVLITAYGIYADDTSSALLQKLKF